jgi:hypothetical protein
VLVILIALLALPAQAQPIDGDTLKQNGKTYRLESTDGL